MEQFVPPEHGTNMAASKRYANGVYRLDKVTADFFRDVANYKNREQLDHPRRYRKYKLYLLARAHFIMFKLWFHDMCLRELKMPLVPKRFIPFIHFLVPIDSIENVKERILA